MASKRDKFRYELRHRFLVLCGTKGGTKEEFDAWLDTDPIKKEIADHYLKLGKDLRKADVLSVWQTRFAQTNPKQYSILGESCPGGFRYPMALKTLHPDLFEDEDTEVEILDENGRPREAKVIWISVLFDYATQDQFARSCRVKRASLDRDLAALSREEMQAQAILEAAHGNSSVYCADFAQGKADAA